MRLSLCLYAVLFAACGSVQLRNADSGESGRGEAGTQDLGGNGTGGIGTGGIAVNGSGGQPTNSFGGQSGNGSGGVGGSSFGAGGFIGGSQGGLTGNTGGTPGTDGAMTHDCSLCQLNCVSSVQFDAGVQYQFDYCDGCISNCPLEYGIKLFCRCNNGCGFDPTQGTCPQ